MFHVSQFEIWILKHELFMVYDSTLSLLRRFGQGRSCSPHYLVSQRAKIKEESVHGCRRAKYKTYRLLDYLWAIMSTSNAFYYPRPRKLNYLSPWLYVCKQDHRKRCIHYISNCKDLNGISATDNWNTFWFFFLLLQIDNMTKQIYWAHLFDTDTFTYNKLLLLIIMYPREYQNKLKCNQISI